MCCRLREEKRETPPTGARARTHTHPTCILRNIWKYKICKKLVTEVGSVEGLGIRKRGEHAQKYISLMEYYKFIKNSSYKTVVI